MATLTSDQVLALAPDAASAKAGQALSQPRKWVLVGGNEKALWGECHLPELTAGLESSLRAQLPEAIAFLLLRVEEVAAQTSDVPHLMQALPPLVQVQRYGDVRQTDVSSVRHVIDGLVTRTCIGLPGACSALNDDAAEEMFAHLGAVDQAVRLLDDADHRANWRKVLSQLSASDTVHGLVAGSATRLLFDGKAISSDELRVRLGLALAASLPANPLGRLGGGAPARQRLAPPASPRPAGPDRWMDLRLE